MPDHPTIYFIRHGETDWNRDRRYQGQTDIPLNAKGRAQASRNGQVLREFLPEIAEFKFVASPLGRARATMEILRSELGLPRTGYTLDSRLLELSYGNWEGSLQDDLFKTEPEAVAARKRDTFRWRPEGGESYADLYERVSGWAAAVDQNCVVVAHGGVSRCLRAYMLSFDPSLIPTLDSPQDRVLILSPGDMRWL